MNKTNLAQLEAFITPDGSTIRELAGRATPAAVDRVVIPPGTAHKLWNTGAEPLVLLCCCAPSYSDDDTVMTGG